MPYPIDVQEAYVWLVLSGCMIIRARELRATTHTPATRFISPFGQIYKEGVTLF